LTTWSPAGGELLVHHDFGARIAAWRHFQGA
jgi:hypothetical protein